MRIKYISAAVALLLISTVLFACDTGSSSELISDSTIESIDDSIEQTTDKEESLIDASAIDYSKFEFQCAFDEFVAKYGTNFKKIATEDEFDEVLNCFLSFEPSVNIYITCDTENVESKLTNIHYTQINKYDDYVHLMIWVFDFDVDAIRELGKDKEISRVTFVATSVTDA